MLTRLKFDDFSKRELNGIMILWIVILVITLSPLLYRRLVTPEPRDNKAFEREIQAFLASEAAIPKVSYKRNRALPVLVAHYIPFDPNTADERLWKRLGVSGRTAKILLNYVKKGGRFYKKSDLRKIYSLDSATYLKLKPWVTIPENRNRPVAFTTKPRALLPPVELNSADSARLDGLPGIGPAFAMRIIRYRDRLGGFSVKEQLREVYGIDSLVYEKLSGRVIADDGLLKKMNVNTAFFDEFRKHPYLTYRQVNAILQYRKQHGNYRSSEDLLKTGVLTDSLLLKLAPYLTY